MIEVSFADTCATVEAAPNDSESRTIRGTAVPWNQVGTVADGTQVRFSPNALDAAARPIVVRGHDGPPIGRTADNQTTAAGMSTTVRVSRVRDGDEALILAADGVLGMFSVGVNPTEWRYDDDGVMVVDAAEWHHTALLPFGAFAAATVTDVAASASQPSSLEGTQTMPDTLETVATAAPVIEAAPPAGQPPEPPAGQPPEPPERPQLVPVHGPTSPGEPLTLTRVAGLIGAGMQNRLGAAGIRAQINAALTNVTSANLVGVTRPAYRSEIVGLIDHGMPTVRALQQRPLPATGMRIEYPRWSAVPDSTGEQLTQKSEIASGDVTVGIVGDDIKTWAQGNDVSFQAMQRSDPSFIDAYLRAAAADAGKKYDTYVINTLLATATAGVPSTSFVSNVQALFAALNPALVPAGPMFLAVSFDVFTDMIGVTGLDGPAFWSASINLGDMLPDMAASGLVAFLDVNMPAASMLLGSRLGAASYGGPETSADVRVVDVSLLGVDIGVYFYAALAIEYAQAFSKLTGVTTMAASTASKAK